MNRVILRAGMAVAAALASVGVLVPPVAAGDAKGPACTDFSGKADFYYSATEVPGEAIVQIAFDLAAPSCTTWTYTLHVYDASGQRELISTPAPGDGSQRLTLRASVPGDPVVPPDTVCITTTTTRNGRISDVAPDVGCALAQLGVGGPGQTWH